MPNALCVMRMGLSPVISYFIMQGHYQAAFGAFFVAGISDFLDGQIAVRFNQRTVLGSFLDPAADKVMMATLSVSLALIEALPPSLVALFLIRDLGLLAGAFAMRARSLPPAVRWTRELFRVSAMRSLEVAPSFVSRANTFGQISLIGFTLMQLAFGFPPAILTDALCWAVAGTTVVSGLGYVILPGFASIGRPSK